MKFLPDAFQDAKSANSLSGKWSQVFGHSVVLFSLTYSFLLPDSIRLREVKLAADLTLEKGYWQILSQWNSTEEQPFMRKQLALRFMYLNKHNNKKAEILDQLLV